MKSSDIYDEKFFEGIDGVTNALDNVKSRQFHRHLSIARH